VVSVKIEKKSNELFFPVHFLGVFLILGIVTGKLILLPALFLSPVFNFVTCIYGDNFCLRFVTSFLSPNPTKTGGKGDKKGTKWGQNSVFISS
jgi:hypothetical protein